ncbi:hypothetical protein ACFV2X_49945 [Streptomyces sp. NPDC059679]|uniref:hypothetical protein n=1 Tax=Streptomyces sp. NPDC059679 TaxID=3346903 RepID=UPI00369B4F02
MTHDDRAQATAVIALLAALLAAVWAWRLGWGPTACAEVTGVVYVAVAALVSSALHAPLGAVVVTSVKYTAITAAYSVWVAAAALYAVCRLLSGRTSKGVFV